MPVLTALVAFLIGGVVVAATGHNPLITYRDIFNGAGLNWFFHPTTDTDRHRRRTTSRRRCSRRRRSILTGLAVAFAFRCGMFNIGGQGQYFVGLYVGDLDRLVVGGHVDAAAHPARRSSPRRSPARSGPGSPAS